MQRWALIQKNPFSGSVVVSVVASRSHHLTLDSETHVWLFSCAMAQPRQKIVDHVEAADDLPSTTTPSRWKVISGAHRPCEQVSNELQCGIENWN